MQLSTLVSTAGLHIIREETQPKVRRCSLLTPIKWEIVIFVTFPTLLRLLPVMLRSPVIVRCRLSTIDTQQGVDGRKGEVERLAFIKCTAHAVSSAAELPTSFHSTCASGATAADTSIKGAIPKRWTSDASVRELC